MDVRSTASDHKTVVLNLAVEKKDMRFNVADVINLTTQESTLRVDLRSDLGLEAGEYYVYDYWNREFLGTFRDFLPDYPAALRQPHLRGAPGGRQASGALHLPAHRPGRTGHYRAYLRRRKARADRRVSGGGGEPYEVVVAMPQELRVFGEGNHTTTNELEYLADNICRCTFHPEQNGPFRWEIAFTPRTR